MHICVPAPVQSQRHWWSKARPRVPPLLRQIADAKDRRQAWFLPVPIRRSRRDQGATPASSPQGDSVDCQCEARPAARGSPTGHACAPASAPDSPQRAMPRLPSTMTRSTIHRLTATPSPARESAIFAAPALRLEAALTARTRRRAPQLGWMRSPAYLRVRSTSSPVPGFPVTRRQWPAARSASVPASPASWGLSPLPAAAGPSHSPFALVARPARARADPPPAAGTADPSRPDFSRRRQALWTDRGRLRPPRARRRRRGLTTAFCPPPDRPPRGAHRQTLAGRCRHCRRDRPNTRALQHPRRTRPASSTLRWGLAHAAAWPPTPLTRRPDRPPP